MTSIAMIMMVDLQMKMEGVNLSPATLKRTHWNPTRNERTTGNKNKRIINVSTVQV